MKKLIQLTDVTSFQASSIYVHVDNINVIEPSGCSYFGCVIKMDGGDLIKIREPLEQVVDMVEQAYEDSFMSVGMDNLARLENVSLSDFIAEKEQA